MAGSNKTKFSLGGIALVVLAFVLNHFFGFGADATAKTKNDSGTQPAVTAPKSGQQSQSSPATTNPKVVTPKTTTPKTTAPSTTTTKPEPTPTTPTTAPKEAPPSGPGFTSRRSLASHFEKHGHEFHHRSQTEYLHMAQRLRDKELGPRVLEAVRRDGVTTRFDRDTGAFIAFNRDRTIRTLFKPNDGERYFRRQANRDD